MMTASKAEGQIQLTVTGNVVEIAGTLQLQTVRAYERLLQPVSDAIHGAKGGAVTLDIREVAFMNSSGVTAIARLILIAKTNEVRIVLRGNPAFRWQRATLRTLARLADTVDVELT